MNTKINALGIAWASQRPNSRTTNNERNASLLNVSLAKASKSFQLVISFHAKLLEEAKLKREDRVDVGIDAEKKHIYIKKTNDGNKLVAPGGSKKSTRTTVRFTSWNAWGFKDHNVTISDCSEVEAVDGLIAAKLPDCIFK